MPLAIVSRLTRSNMLDVIAQDYVRTARAKGASEPRVIGWHAFRNTLVPLVTVLGLEVGYLLAGAVYVETVFSWPGIGFMMVNAILTRDFPLVQGGVLLIAATYVLINLATDLLYACVGSARAPCPERGAGGAHRRPASPPAVVLARGWPRAPSIVAADRGRGGAGSRPAAARSQPDAAEPAAGAAAHAGLSARLRPPRPRSAEPRDLGRARVLDGGRAGHAPGHARRARPSAW